MILNTMMIICPQCNQQYVVEHRFVSSQGRKVRCSSCQNVWIHKPERELNFMDLEIDPKNKQGIIRYVARLDWIVASFIASALMMGIYVGRDFISQHIFPS